MSKKNKKIFINFKRGGYMKEKKKLGRPRKYEGTSKVYGISLTQGERDELAKIHDSLTESIKILISESVKAKDSAS